MLAASPPLAIFPALLHTVRQRRVYQNRVCLGTTGHAQYNDLLSACANNEYTHARAILALAAHTHNTDLITCGCMVMTVYGTDNRPSFTFNIYHACH